MNCFLLIFVLFSPLPGCTIGIMSDVEQEEVVAQDRTNRPTKIPTRSLPPKPVSRLAPVIFSAVETPKYFSTLDFSKTRVFVEALNTLVSPISNAEVAVGGDLFVFPFDLAQNKALLQLEVVNNVRVKCCLTKSETEFRGKITGVPISESEASIMSLLTDQHVIKVHRVFFLENGIKPHQRS